MKVDLSVLFISYDNPHALEKLLKLKKALDSKPFSFEFLFLIRDDFQSYFKTDPPDVKLIFTPYGKRAKNRNLLIEKSSGATLFFIDEASEFDAPSLADTLCEVLKTQGDIFQFPIVAYGKRSNPFCFMQIRRQVLGKLRFSPPKKLGLNFLDTAGLAVRASLIKEMKGFQEKLHRFEDRDFFLRSLERNLKYIFVDTTRIKKRYDRRGVLESLVVQMSDYWYMLYSFKLNKLLTPKKCIKALNKSARAIVEIFKKLKTKDKDFRNLLFFLFFVRVYEIFVTGLVWLPQSLFMRSKERDFKVVFLELSTKKYFEARPDFL